jgi:hypothetical protein
VTLVYKTRRKGPKTHVLVIGVGGYRHLPGGTGPMMRDPIAYGGLGQLSSPPESALAVRDLFLDSTPDAWQAPLGTVDLLVSPHPDDPWPDGRGVAYTEPTGTNIKKAFDRWKRRCNEDAWNVAIFYFCGHGLEGSEQYLLASDFGANENRKGENAIAIDSTIKGLWHCKAKTQCVFVDACRVVATAAQSAELGNALALATYVPGMQPVYVEHPLVLRAANSGSEAFGKPRQVSYFTRALVDALLGLAAQQDNNGDWVVTTESLAFKFSKVLSIVAPNVKPPRPEPGPPSELYRPPEPPAVHLTVGCEPGEALRSARLSCRHSTKAIRKERDPAAERWELDIEAGGYELAARFDDLYKNKRDFVLVDPPRLSRNLTVVRR